MLEGFYKCGSAGETVCSAQWKRVSDSDMHDSVQGLVKAVGVSNYGPRQLERIHQYLTERGVPLASAQVAPIWPYAALVSALADSLEKACIAIANASPT